MADIQSAAAEIRRGKKKKEEERTNYSMKIWSALFHRATIIKNNELPCKVHMQKWLVGKEVSKQSHKFMYMY